MARASRGGKPKKRQIKPSLFANRQWFIPPHASSGDEWIDDMGETDFVDDEGGTNFVDDGGSRL